AAPSSSNFQKDQSWRWNHKSYKRNEKFGAPPLLKMEYSSYPKPVGGDLEISPRKLYTDTLASDEEGDIIKISKRKDDYVEVGITPLDGDDPYIYSTEVGVTPFS